MDLELLPPELQELIRRQLSTGRYASVEDLLHEALRVHGDQEAYLAASSEEFRQKIARGIEQAAQGSLRDGEEAMARIRRRMLARRGEAE